MYLGPIFPTFLVNFFAVELISFIGFCIIIFTIWLIKDWCKLGHFLAFDWQACCCSDPRLLEQPGSTAYPVPSHGRCSKVRLGDVISSSTRSRLATVQLLNPLTSKKKFFLSTYLIMSCCWSLFLRERSWFALPAVLH